jgi:hypothetical protein
MEQSKACGKCKQIKPLSQFSPHSKGYLRTQSQCKECRLIYNSAYKAKNKDVINSRRRNKYAENPNFYKEQAKGFREANPDKHRESVRKSAAKNPDKKRASSKEWRKKFPEKVKANWQSWSAKNPEKLRQKKRTRRARLQSAITEPYTDQDVLDAYGEVCYLCNRQIDLQAPRWTAVPGWENGLHIDHVLPIGKSGQDTLSNVRPTHGLCNLTRPRS